MKRVLVTGSRNWPVEKTYVVRKILGNTLNMLGLFVLVHGACPSGVDAMAAEWAVGNGAETDPHPAEWSRYGPGAGPRRNAAMVAKGAAYCVGFPLPGARVGSRGTYGCMDLAVKAGIQTWLVDIDRFGGAPLVSLYDKPKEW